MKKIMKGITIVLLLFTLILLVNQEVFASDIANSLTKMEYSEEFQEWLELPDEEKNNVMMPRMYDVTYTKVEYSNPLYNAKMLRANINSDYNLKDVIPDNLLIRNQLQTNTCWAFARLSSLETNLALANYKSGTNLSKVYDFSERHMEYATSRYFLNDVENPNGYNKSVGDGGTRYMADSYLANGYGAVLESEMPFENNENIIDINQIQGKTISSQLYDTVDFPNYQDETGENRNAIMNQIKHHIQNYGSVYAGLHGDSASISDYSCYNNSTGAKFCNNEGEHPENHAVSIIGWDDNYNVENFDGNARPISNGAWIVRNSWGEKNAIGTIAQLKELLFDTLTDQCIENGWDTAEKIPNEFLDAFAAELDWTIENDTVYEKYGDNGIIYVSYEDVNISKQMSGIVKASDTVDYENIYGYDELGPSEIMELKNSSVMLCNIFNKKTNGTEYLNQIQLYVPDTCTCKVYVNPNGTNKTKNDLQLVLLKAGETETFNTGYHTLEFAKPIKINSDSFAVVVEIQSTTDTTLFAMEAKPTISLTNPYSSVKIENEKCFMAIGNNLENCEWYDLGKLSEASILLPNGDSTIKAFTTSELIDESLKNIVITNPPTKTDYWAGEDFDKTGMVVTANYNSRKNPSVVLDSSSYSISNGTNLRAGQTSVTITYEDKTVEQPITVIENKVESIEIITPPTNLEYWAGDDFDKTGMVVMATYTDETTVEITDYTITNGTNLKNGQSSITVSYEGKTAEQTITVKANPVVKLEITQVPDKVDYVAGQNFNKEGMIVKATYTNGTVKEITDYEIQDGNDLAEGQETVTISYEGQTITQDITVVAKAITQVSIKTAPTKTKYIQNKEELDLTGGVIEVKYNDDTTENIDMTSNEVSAIGFDNSNLGKITITLTYESKTTQYEVEIIEEVVIKAENSKMDNAVVVVEKVKAYYFTDDSNKDYTLIDVRINGIEKNTSNDKLEYYYYISPNKNESNITDWVKIDGNQGDNIKFTIDTTKVANYNEISDSDVVYLYIKEVATKGGNQSVLVSNSMELKSDVEVETYVDNSKENINSNNHKKEPTDDTVATDKLPNTGTTVIILAVILIFGIGIIVFIRYKNLSKYVK